MGMKEALELIEQALEDKRKLLDLSGQELIEIPKKIAQLKNLTALYLDDNQLREIPKEIAQLKKLNALSLGSTQLTEIPKEIAQLSNLTMLFLDDNQLTEIPKEIAQLKNLTALYLSDNQLTEIPKEIAQLKNLTDLSIGGNQLTEIPKEIALLKKLEYLSLHDNPLNPALQSAYDRGWKTLQAYLRSLEEPDRQELLYEAKLVFVGEGDVGKTTLLKAMTGGEPREKEPTTHGVNIDIQSLRLPHPDKEDVEIRLNAWDFGGQEVYRVTHQFFFSRRSIYLLVWEPRAGVQQCQVEDWLRLIRLRVGDDARIIIVSTHSRTGSRIARIDKPVIERDFGPLIFGFHEVDSLVDDPETGEKVGIAELKEMVAEAARELEQMGMPFNRDWREARDELLALEAPRIAYEEFAAVCERHGLDAISTKTLANLMHDLGYIVYYGDDERLKDDVVLQPEWLTKAIGFVLEDRTTQEMDGILPDGRLKDVWLENPADGETRFDPDLYPFFLRLMEKYDALYRLEVGTASLVAQHVRQVRPKELPWLPEDEPAPDRRRITMVCMMDEIPPGLVPWMIVRTHDYAHKRRGSDGNFHRLHWQKGMFLRNKSHGEALLELREREFHVCAEAVWPEFFMSVLRRILSKLIIDNWPGIEGRYYFAIPCLQKLDGQACEGRFDIEALRQFLDEGDKTIRCQVCRTHQNIVKLLFGFVEEDTREQLTRIESKLDLGVEELKRQLEGFESRVASYVMTIMQAIASESKEGPRLFTIEPADGKWDQLFAERYRLHLWCEAEGCQHPVIEEGQGIYEIKATREWVGRVAPYANLIAGVLKTVLPLVAPAVNLYFGAKTIDESGLKDHLDLMKGAAAKLLPEIKVADRSDLRGGVLTSAERSGVMALHTLLREVDPNHERLGLRRVPTYTGDYLWLCARHYDDSQPKIPSRIG